MNPLINAGTSEAQGDCRCERCDFVGDVRSYSPAMSVYHDIACPNCGSTNNAHNRAYFDNLQASMAARKAEGP